MSIFKTKKGVSFSPFELTDDKFIDKYDVRYTDFIVLSNENGLIRDTLYRKGGIFIGDETQDYFLILKYSPSKKNKDFIKKYKIKNPYCLESSWVIIDADGNEIIEFKDSLDYAYLIKNSCLYKYKNNIYSLLDPKTPLLEDNFYNQSIESAKFVFINIKNKVVKISKENGDIEYFD